MKVDAQNHNPNPAYIVQIVRNIGLPQRQIAKRMGVSYSTLKAWIAGTHPIPYPAQYTLESMQNDGEGDDEAT